MNFSNSVVKVNDLVFEQYISQYEIDTIVHETATQINSDYANIVSSQNPLIIIGVLNGSFMFLSDIVKKINIPLEVHFIKVSSYSGTKTTGNVVDIIGLTEDISGKNVIIVEDIIDTGLTISKLLETFKLQNPESIEVCTCLYKETKCIPNLDVKYIGKHIDDKFVIGYGLDYNKQGRNYNAIYSLLPN
uniref:hypoxanthine phosphoribosyltransferase n=1 Tax=viral metagenome TaxID=1070528 RepID=A0A6C0BS06_9ZZZZ